MPNIEHIEHLRSVSQRFHKHKREFRRLLRHDLKPYWDTYTGFDVVKFDEEWVKPKDGESTKDAVRRKYGPNAVELILKLLG